MLLTSITNCPSGGRRAAPDQLDFTHVVVGAVHVVPAVHGDVARMHLGPAVRRARLGEVTWRAEAEVRTPACSSLLRGINPAVSSLETQSQARTLLTEARLLH